MYISHMALVLSRRCIDDQVYIAILCFCLALKTNTNIHYHQIFYTRKEVAMRIAILYTANVCGSAFSGLIAVGIFKMDGVAGQTGWRWLFIIQGIVTFVISLMSAFILPDEPLNTKWLSNEERQLAHHRVARETVEGADGTSTWAGLKEACKDYKIWLFLLEGHITFASTNFKNFFPTIVSTLGYSQTATLGLICPPYIIAGIISILWSWNSGELI